MMAAAASARDLAAARLGDGRVGLGGRVAVLAGAARRGAASFGSLLIAAVPSSHRELMTMSTGAQTKHRAARASALNEMWVEVNRSLGAGRDRVALVRSSGSRWLDARRAGLARILERQDDSSRRPVQLAILVCHALSEISQTTPFDFTAAKLSVYATPSYLLAHTCSLVVGHTARASGHETTP